MQRLSEAQAVVNRWENARGGPLLRIMEAALLVDQVARALYERGRL
jgi:hypothetical protein